MENWVGSTCTEPVLGGKGLCGYPRTTSAHDRHQSVCEVHMGILACMSNRGDYI